MASSNSTEQSSPPKSQAKDTSEGLTNPKKAFLIPWLGVGVCIIIAAALGETPFWSSWGLPSTVLSSPDVMKYGALALLVVQQSSVVMLLRVSRLRCDKSEKPLYISSTAIACCEGVKLLLCVVAILVEARGSFSVNLDLDLL